VPGHRLHHGKVGAVVEQVRDEAAARRRRVAKGKQAGRVDDDKGDRAVVYFGQADPLGPRAHPPRLPRQRDQPGARGVEAGAPRVLPADGHLAGAPTARRTVEDGLVASGAALR